MGERAPDATGTGRIAHVAVGFCVVIPLVELGRAASWPVYRPELGLVAIAMAVTVPLHLCLVWHAVRGTPTPHGRLVFAALLVTSGTAAVIIGETWTMMLAFVALGGFLVLPLGAALPVLFACWGLVLLVSTGFEDGYTPLYFSFSVVFRAFALYGLIWLVAAHRRLVAARDRLRDTAVVRERTRIAGELHDVVAPVLERAVAATADTVPAVVVDSRATLLQARHIIGGYRRLSRARDLDTAIALLAAAGATARLDAAGVDLDAPATPDFRAALRSAITDVLTRDPGGPVIWSSHPARTVRASPSTNRRCTVPERTPQQRQAMLVFVGLHVTIFAFYLVQGLTNFGDPGGTPWALLTLVPIACQAHHSRAAARGERATAWPVTLALLIAAVVVIAILDVQSSLGWWLVGASAAMLLPIPHQLPAVLWFLPSMGVMLAINLPYALAYDPATAVWYFFYVPTLFLLGAGGLVVSARLAHELDLLRSARIELAEVAVQRERLRVSRDLHDLLGHSLSAVALKGELAMRLQDTDPERAAREIDDLASIATTALADLRATTYERRDVRLAGELTGAVRLLDAAGIAARVDGSGDDLPERVDSLLGWAVREGITNVLRHSEAATCTITVERGPATVSIVIDNDAPGVPGGEPGSGLVGLAGRPRELGGELRVEHTTDRFHLRLDVPVDAAVAP